MRRLLLFTWPSINLLPGPWHLIYGIVSSEHRYIRLLDWAGNNRMATKTEELVQGSNVTRFPNLLATLKSLGIPRPEVKKLIVLKMGCIAIAEHLVADEARYPVTERDELSKNMDEFKPTPEIRNRSWKHSENIRTFLM
jgi:hypothetical protein